MFTHKQLHVHLIALGIALVPALPVESREQVVEAKAPRSVHHESPPADQADSNRANTPACLNLELVWRRKGNITKPLLDHNEPIPFAVQPQASLGEQPEGHNFATYFSRGLHQLAHRKLKAALDSFNEAIRLDPEDAYAYALRGNVRSKLGDFDGAVADLGHAIRLEPDEDYYHSLRGYIYFNKNDLPAAIVDFCELVRLAPNDARSYLQRGATYAALGDLEQALSDYNQAILLDPESVVAFDGRSEIYYAKGEIEKARLDESEAVRLRRKDGRIHK